MTDNIKAVGAVVVSAITGVITIWWLYEVATRLGTPPVTDPEGNVTLDAFQRAKDILIVVLPLFSASIAYWVGSRGTTEAKKDAGVAKDKLDAVVDVSAPGVLEAARKAHPEAFTK